jgi:hypothetical protein
MRAVNAVAPNLAPPPEERRPVSETKALYRWKHRNGCVAAANAESYLTEPSHDC